MSTAQARLRQRAEYTHKQNLKAGRHGWLRLTPAYSVKIVEELLAQRESPLRIYDPFSGTATTALSAAYHGHVATTTDINPFLVWLGKAKTDYYSPKLISAAQKASSVALNLVREQSITPVEAPPLHKIERWWNGEALSFLCALRAAIDVAAKPQSQSHALLLVAFCRTLITLSSAAFNHQSMSFKNDKQLLFALGVDLFAQYADDVQFVLRGAAENPAGDAEVVLGDARNAASAVKGPFELVITSPPYANRMSYIRELRPYMYWLGYLTSGREAGELDWTAIGGTWGMATSRLVDWTRPPEHFVDDVLQDAIRAISHHENQSGHILSNYVAKYCDDMWLHFKNLVPTLAPNAELHYIVGNSTFYGTLLPVERLYAAMLTELGFAEVECRPIRKRNSKKELIEFDVCARWMA